ncbi:sodium-dependent nutrient amino acid transporter 1-like isoform X1 [Teleopsis dalmanni]|uniref:sodium-dependent nutrient amino acid transporter 1-like isoform X1 n=1 Tax=Teleopsis dalmanni TaxID=139649 RepID=UPI0018CD854D|nr:sodium-dependent nutrient amino acid transporter 1-like isoform X1 [Teleopsis dalmanni]
MNSTRKSRTSDQPNDDYYNLKKQTNLPPAPNNKQTVAPVPPTPPMEPMRLRSDSTATSVYVIGGNNVHASNPPTMERKQLNRQSWINMRQKVEDALPVTSSPQTTRSYVSTVDTGFNGGGSGSGSGGGGGGINSRGGTVSGRTTAASGRISGATTISGSNNTLNDIISDYHSHEAGSSDYQFAETTTSPTKNLSGSGSFNLANGSTVKLLSTNDDESNQQTKCSVFRGLVLCICLNITYANIVRFPRELDRYSSAYLIPYVLLLFLVGLPIILLEVSVGQFLGQGAAHTWRASPIFKGACIISRFASWLSTVWVSLQAVLAVAYIGMFFVSSMPFKQCGGNVKLEMDGYTVVGNSGQECLQKTFLTPFWENPLYFGLLTIGLIFIWFIVMLCTHNSKVLRRSLFFFGVIGFFMLCCLAGWEVNNSLNRSYFPQLWPFDSTLLLESNIWFNALMQVLFSINCGFGALPMLTGKFLYKGDAVRTSIVYLCFNLLVNAIAVTLFMVQFDLSANSGSIIDELKPLTSIYDRVLYDRPTTDILVKLIPSLIFGLVLIAALVSITVAIYTSTRLVPRHPNYVICLVALVVCIISLAAPRFMIARILDTRIVGTMVITALIFELIATTWIYGAKNIYTDLEFSIGRPIFKGWMVLWCISPAILTGLLVWWCSDDDQYDLLAEYMPRWAPILFVLAIIFFIAGIQIFRQVEYNFFGMICEASKSAKEWGPADPLARHAWKQWRSVCQDTGQRDFTLRRRGTRDYTHSIKKGQYSSSSKYVPGQITQPNWKSSTPGNSSPNYSGSMFGDSAIEEDISVEKFPGISQQFVPFQANDGKPLRLSHRQRMQQSRSHMGQQQHRSQPEELQHGSVENVGEKHREIVYIRRMSGEGQHATRIEITPSNENITYANGGVRNPLGRSNGSIGNGLSRSSSNSNCMEHNRNSAVSVVGHKLPPQTEVSSGDHICWRKFSVNPAEYSTEL